MKSISLITLAIIFAMAPSIATAQPNYRGSVGGSSDNSVQPCINSPNIGASSVPILLESVCGPVNGTTEARASARQGHLGVRAAAAKTSPDSLLAGTGALVYYEDTVFFTPKPGVAAVGFIEVKLNLHFSGTLAISGDTALAFVKGCAGTDGAGVRSLFCEQRTQSSLGSKQSSGFLPSGEDAIQTPLVLVPLNTPVIISLQLETFAVARNLDSASSEFLSSLAFPTGSDVFELPPGITVNAPDSFLFDNRYYPNGAPPSDSTPPVTSAVLSSSANAAGWHRQNVTLTLTATDADSGAGNIIYSAAGAQAIAPTTFAGPSVAVELSAEGTTTVSFYAVDQAGNSEAVQTLTVNIDKTPPVVTTSRSPAANGLGWNNTPVTASFAAQDALSGIAGAASKEIVLAGEGSGQTASQTFVDIAGNSATGVLSGVNIDRTAPVVTLSVTPPANSAGWNNADVTAIFQAADVLSGVLQPAEQAAVFTTEGAGLTATRTFSDRAGNTASRTAAVNLDKTAPEGDLQFDPVSQDALIFGHDALSGIASGAFAPVRVTASQWTASDDFFGVDVRLPGESGINTQLRTYALSDRADNVLTIESKVRRSNKQVKARLLSLTYQRQPVVMQGPNLSWFVWASAPGGSFLLLEQSMFLEGDRIGAHYIRQTDETKVVQLRLPLQPIATRAGMALLRMTTNRGALRIEY